MTQDQINSLWDEAYVKLLQSDVPQHLHGGLARWIREGQRPGDFLRAVLTNNLFESMARADLDSRAGLHALTMWLYGYAPSGCWGSVEAVKQWAVDAEARQAA